MKRRMLGFVHMHKCAGTTVVKAARKSGFKLPRGHKNGNLRTADGGNLRYVGISRAAFDALIADLRRDEVDFFSMEFDFPPTEYFTAQGIDLFTVLRHPFSRAVSNFRYAKIRGNAPPDRSFREFMNKEWTKDGPLSRASNYYIRKLCQLSPVDPVTEAHLSQASENLSKFNEVVILEAGNLECQLMRLGIADIRPARIGGELQVKADLRPEDTLITDNDEEWFVEGNRLDISLFESLRS